MPAKMPKIILEAFLQNASKTPAKCLPTESEQSGNQIFSKNATSNAIKTTTNCRKCRQTACPNASKNAN